MSELVPLTPPPGWYPDATGMQRWWDGRAWGAYAPPAPPLLMQPLPAAAFVRPPKDTAVAFLLAIFLGGVGAHHFYLGHTGRAVTMLCLYLLGLATWWLGVGFLLLLAVWFWAVIDLFLVPGYVRAVNARSAVILYR